MRPGRFLNLALMLVCCAAARVAAGEVTATLGVFTLSDGLDVQLGYRADHSRWQLGYRFVRWTEEFEFRETVLTQTTTMKTGPTLNYLFTPSSRASWYLGVALYRWTQEEQSARTGTIGKDSTTAPFFGGGYRGRFGGYGYFSVGLLLSPAKLTTTTVDSSEESTGADAQVLIGVAF
jgi:hypothetical protein